MDPNKAFEFYVNLAKVVGENGEEGGFEYTDLEIS